MAVCDIRDSVKGTGRRSPPPEYQIGEETCFGQRPGASEFFATGVHRWMPVDRATPADGQRFEKL